MTLRALKLGTRRSALARAQSTAVAHELQRRHPGVRVELVGIDTRGDKILDQPLSAVQGKEFFTAEIDAALLRGDIDLTVHSYKDLALQRDARLALAAVPRRQQPHDIVIFAADVGQRLAVGEALRIGSSSPRRASFVPPFLDRVLPRPAHAAAAGRVAGARVQLVELRGNVDSRLRRLHEPRTSARQLDGVVLAFAGLARLWADETMRPQLQQLLLGLPRMILPLSVCPPAPAQGALAIECRRDDAATGELLATLDDAPTRESVARERALLDARGGGCQQRFGAVHFTVPRLGALCYTRAAEEHAGTLQIGEPRLDWTPAQPLPAPASPVRAWDGSRVPAPAAMPSEEGVARAGQRLREGRPLFVAHRRAWPASGLQVGLATPVWVPGPSTWFALADAGVWVQGCAEGLGIGAVAGLLAEPWLQLPPLPEWLVLTHAGASEGWAAGSAVATYSLGEPLELPPADATHIWWASAAQFAQWRARGAHGAGDRIDAVAHACGPGKTYEQLRAAGVQNLRVFPQSRQWREWLQQ